MKLNYFRKLFSVVGSRIATTVLCLSAIALVWQGAFFFNQSAMAAPTSNSFIAADTGEKVKDKTSEDAGRAKGFIRDTADKVERTAKKNAERVDRATDNKGNFAERKAKRDAARIEQRAEEDAARTQKAVDKTKNAVKGTVDRVNDAVKD
jgi:hypothetical protein